MADITDVDVDSIIERLLEGKKVFFFSFFSWRKREGEGERDRETETEF